MKCRSGGKQLSPNDHVFQLPAHVLLPYKCWQCVALLPTYLGAACSTLHPKKNLTGVLKTTPWIYFAKWDKAGCDKKNNLLVCTALMSSLCFSFCAKYLMFNDGFLRKISAHCQESAPSRCSFDPFDFDGAHPRSSAGHHWIDNCHTMSSEETYLECTKLFRCL